MESQQIRPMFENVACLARGGYTPREETYIDQMVDSIMKMHKKALDEQKAKIIDYEERLALRPKSKPNDCYCIDCYRNMGDLPEDHDGRCEHCVKKIIKENRNGLTIRD
jgi:hypothetical protein